MPLLFVLFLSDVLILSEDSTKSNLPEKINCFLIFILLFLFFILNYETKQTLKFLREVQGIIF